MAGADDALEDDGEATGTPARLAEPAPVVPAPRRSYGTIRVTVALLGLAVLGAIFAGVYYAPRNVQPREFGAPAFQLAPGEAKQAVFQPTVAGTPILFRIQVTGPAIDVYVMEKDWSDTLPEAGELRLDRPFSYYSQYSRLNVTGTQDLAIVSDGQTEYLLVFDASDNYYSDDTPAGNATSGVQLTAHYVQEQTRSLVLGYIAATPSVLLVLLTLGRKIVRNRRLRST